MQRIRERLAAATLVLAPALAWGLLENASWGQAGTSSDQQSSQQPGATNQQQPADQQQKQQPNQQQQSDQQQGQQPSQPPADTAQDPNRAVRGQDRTRDQGAQRTGQTLRRFDFGAPIRSGENNVVVGTVSEDGLFHNAGIEEGDQIISVKGRTVRSEEEFQAAIAAGRGRVPVVVMRDGQRKEIMVNLDEWNAQAQGAGGDRSALGIWFLSYPQGARVVHVMPGSPAERAGLRRGDWIVTLNGAPCHDWQAIQQDIGQAEEKSAVDLQVMRNGDMRRMQTELAHFAEVFPESKDWNTIAAEQGYPESQPMFQGQFDGSGRYWTREQMRDRGAQQGEGAYNGRGSQSDAQGLEKRIRELEREVGDLREQLNKGHSTGAKDNNQQNGGRRTSAPPNGR
jgi:C-terminal processing protease CtpA/Prc